MTMLFDMLHHLDKIIEFVRSFLLKIYFRNPNFKDFKQMSPSLAKSIEDILQYNGDDFEADFELNFTVRTAISVKSFCHYVVQVLTVSPLLYLDRTQGLCFINLIPSFCLRPNVDPVCFTVTLYSLFSLLVKAVKIIMMFFFFILLCFVSWANQIINFHVLVDQQCGQGMENQISY